MRNRQHLCWSPAQLADGLHAADDIAPRVSLVSFADVSKRGRITQDVDRFFELGKVFGADQDGGRVAVPGQHDALMLALDAVDKLR